VLDRDYINLLWLIDCCNNGFDAKRHVLVMLITTVQETDSLVAGLAPVVEESFHQHWVLKLNVVDVTVFLAQTTPNPSYNEFVTSDSFKHNLQTHLFSISFNWLLS